MKFTLATAVAALLGVAAAAAKEETTFAVLRFTNKQLTKGRIDPIVFPGKPGAHVHNVMGGSGFGLSSTGKDLTNSKCSNAMVKGDNSNYWYPSLYFHDVEKGSFEPVEIFYVNAYYFFEKSHDDIKAFPMGMAMVSGNSTTRIVPTAGASSNLDPSKGPVNPAKWTCPRLDNNYNPPSWPADSDGSVAGIGDPVNKGEGVGFPDYNCNGYASPLRADVHFPSCYNPKAGLLNFADNMAWPTDNNGYLDCPEGYIHVPHLFLEVYWDTPKFADRWQEGQGKQPFVLSSGDVTGFSCHGDFMSGWDEALLQHIIDTCNTGTSGMDKCPGLFYGLNKDDCTIPSAVDEEVDGVLSKLPGDNPLEGWSYGVGGGSKVNPGGNEGYSTPIFAPSVTSKASSAQGPASTSTKPAPSANAVSSTEPASSTNVASSTKVAASSKPASSTSPAFTNQATESGASQPTTTSLLNLVASTDIAKPVIDNPKTTCKRKIHTIWETVTVTQSASDSPTETASIKPEQLRRYLHNHGRRHGSF